MVLLYEGADELTKAQALLVDGVAAECSGRQMGEEPARSWEEHRFDVSWMSDQVSRDGGVAEAVEVSATWSALPAFMAKMQDAARQTMGRVMGHVSHIYSDGASPYVISSGEYPSDEEALVAYDQLWKDLMQVVGDQGAIISHHHGIGFERAPWMEREHGEVGMRLLRDVKAVIDPAGVINPGKLGL